jgi:hypothetical protein
MIRVSVRLSTPQECRKKVVRFDETIDFDALVQKIAAKLGVSRSNSSKTPTQTRNPTPTKRWQLYIGGDVLVEQTDEIDEGDDLVLVGAVGDDDDDDEHSNNDKLPAASSSVKVERDSHPNDNDDNDDDDDSVVDITDRVLRERRRRLEDEAIQCSDEDSEEHTGTESSSEDSSSESSVDDSSYAEETEKKPAAVTVPLARPRKRAANNNAHKKPPPEPPLQVVMEEKDVPAAPGKPTDKKDTPSSNGLEEVSILHSNSHNNNTAAADQSTKDRIMKLLNTGFHERSNEHEAKNAMKLAQRLMRKHNLSQALLLQERNAANNNPSTTNDEPVLQGGMVEVRIVTRKTGKPAQLARWLSQLMHPIAKNFSVESYYQVRRGHECSVTFYGIYTNAQLAAYAFRIATHRISQMAAEHRPAAPEKKPQRRMIDQDRAITISTKSSRLSYALGIVQGIAQEVEATMQRETKQRLQTLERARRAVSKGEAYEESEDEGDDEGPEDDGPGYSFPVEKKSSTTTAASASKHKNSPAVVSSSNRSSDSSMDDPNRSPAEVTSTSSSTTASANQTPSTSTTTTPLLSGEALHHRLGEMEQQEQTTLVLVNHQERVAKQVLKENNIKIRKAVKRKEISAFDHRSYHKGVEDSKEIDINQRALRDEVRVKRERTV